MQFWKAALNFQDNIYFCLIKRAQFMRDRLAANKLISYVNASSGVTYQTQTKTNPRVKCT